MNLLLLTNNTLLLNVTIIISFTFFNVSKMFICGFKYVKRHCEKSQFVIFSLGQAKMKEEKRKEKIEKDTHSNLVAVFLKLVKSRTSYKWMHDLLKFEMIWCLNRIHYEIAEEDLFFPFSFLINIFISM